MISLGVAVVHAIATKFSTDMRGLKDYISLVVATFDLAKTDKRRLRSKHVLARAALDLHARARSLTLGLSLACEGTYLIACAQFEQLVRDMLEEAANQASSKKTAFLDLPPKMREAHTKGCAAILSKITQDKFRHLSESSVAVSLHSCLVGSPSGSAYNLLVEAFSNNENNFKPEVVADHFKKLGVSDPWESLSGQSYLQNYFKFTSADTKRASKERLERIMDQRNIIMHRNKSVERLGVPEVIECAEFFDALSQSMAEVLSKYVLSI